MIYVKVQTKGQILWSNHILQKKKTKWLIYIFSLILFLIYIIYFIYIDNHLSP